MSTLKKVELPLETRYLRRMPEKYDVILPATDGKRLITCHKQVFLGFDNQNISPGFTRLNLDVRSNPSTETNCVMYVILGNKVTVKRMLTTDMPALDELTLEQDQIIDFCTKYRNRLRYEGFATCFLTKVRGKYVVIHARIGIHGWLLVDFDSINEWLYWSNIHRRQFVIPQRS